MQHLLQGDWESALREFIYKTAFDAYRRLTTLASLREKSRSSVLYYGGVDSSDSAIYEKPQIRSKTVQALITSPPYLQAQEYIRTAKLELYWLGYTEEEVKAIGRLEIPYRQTREKISTLTLEHIRGAIQQQDLQDVLDSYFYYTLRSLENAAQTIRSGGKLCIFVGNPKIGGVEVEIWRIIAEYFQERG
jgi:DNA modification methylase